MPACANTGSQTITITVGEHTDATQSFTYEENTTPVTINSISPNSASPVQKGRLTVTGSNFGTDQALLKVYLASGSGKTYEMKILELTDTAI